MQVSFSGLSMDDPYYATASAIQNQEHLHQQQQYQQQQDQQRQYQQQQQEVQQQQQQDEDWAPSDDNFKVIRALLPCTAIKTMLQAMRPPPRSDLPCTPCSPCGL